MHTLKKVLALALVFAFAFTMMAGATVFTDDSSIDAQNQVNMIYALGIMKGYPDGSFGPTQTITRAEAAKMLYVLKTGKDEGSSNYVNAANPFTDVSTSHWARGYINYCYLNGIIAGVGGGKFNPEGKLTGAQLAKMLLTVIGYDATKANLVGDQWLISTMSLAFENNLFDDYNADVSSDAPREDSAILFYNTIYTATVVLRDGEYTNLNSDGDAYLATVGRKYFSLEEQEGILTAADGFNMYGDIEEDTVQLDNDSDYTYEFETDRTYIGQEVNVVYKVKTNGDKVVYDIVPTEDSDVYTMTLGDIDNGATPDEQIKFNSKSRDLASDFTLYYNYDSNGEEISGDVSDWVDTYLDINSGNPITIVDFDGDGELDYGFVTARTFSYVDSMDSQSISFGEGGVEFLNDDDETVVFADGIEEGDYVFYWQDEANTDDDVYYLTKAESVSGEIEGVSSEAETTIYISGVSGSKSLSVSDVQDLNEAEQDVETGDTYTVFLDGKYWIAALVEGEGIAGSGNYAYVLSATNETGSGAGKKEANVEVLIPGEDDPVVYELNKDSEVYVDGELEEVELDKIVTVPTGEYAVTATTPVVGKLFAYSIKSNGTILLSQDIPNYTTSADIEYSEDSDIFTVSNTAENHNGSYLLADDAVVFYRVSEDGATPEWKIYGAGDFDKDFDLSDDLSSFAYKRSGGFSYIKGAVILSDTDDLPAQRGTGSDLYFGFLTSDPMKGHNSSTDEDYVKYTMWVNGESKSYLIEEETSAVNGVKKKDFVKFTLKADGTIKDIWDADTTTTDAYGGLYGDIQSYNKSSSKVTIQGTIYNITEDTVTIYVDRDAGKGETGSGYPKISSSDADGASNCYYATDRDSSHDLLFIAIDSSATMPDVEED